MKYIKIGVLFLIVFSNAFLQGLAWKALKINDTYSINKKYDVAIILGGYARQNTNGKTILADEGDRIWQGMSLYKNGHIQKLLLSGGNGSLLNPSIKEATFMKKELVNMGFPAKDILIDSDSRNTFENAANCQKIIQDSGYTNILIITSVFHARRSKLAFKKHQINFDILSAKNMHNPNYKKSLSYYIIPSASSLQKWNILMKEFLGILIYSFK